MKRIKTDLSNKIESLSTLHPFYIRGGNLNDISGRKAYADVQVPPLASLGFLPAYILPLQLFVSVELNGRIQPQPEFYFPLPVCRGLFINHNVYCS